MKLTGGGGLRGSMRTTLDSTLGGGRKLFFDTCNSRQKKKRNDMLVAQCVMCLVFCFFLCVVRQEEKRKEAILSVHSWDDLFSTGAKKREGSCLSSWDDLFLTWNKERREVLSVPSWDDLFLTGAVHLQIDDSKDCHRAWRLDAERILVGTSEQRNCILKKRY